jgi:AraC-like DNA-binding protein
MALEFETPAQALSPIVNAYILYDEDESAQSRNISPLGTQFLWFVLDGSVTIKSKLKGDITAPRMSMLGFYTQPFRTSQTKPARVVAVNLKPYGCHALFGMEMIAYQDFLYDMAPLALCEGIYERLARQPDMQGIKEVLDEWLALCVEATGARTEGIAAIITAIHSANGNVTLEQLMTGFGLTERGLLKLFNRWVGVTPRLYMRLYRFNCVIGRLEDERTALDEMIAEAGYADGVGFVRDFLRFTSCRPAVLRRVENIPLSRERLKEIMLQIR